MTIDRSRAAIKESGFQFEPFRPVSDVGEPLASLDLPETTEIILFERGGAYRALLIRQMCYHHLAQGSLLGHPYLVAF